MKTISQETSEIYLFSQDTDFFLCDLKFNLQSKHVLKCFLPLVNQLI